MPALAGCLSDTDVAWGTGSGEYSTDFEDNNLTIWNNLGASTTDEITVVSENESTITGRLVQTRSFESPSRSYRAMASWIVKEMSYSSAQDVDPTDVYVSIANLEKDWESPTLAKILEDYGDDWMVIGLVPENENVMDAILYLDTNQAIEISGYSLGDGNFLVTSITYGNGERVVDSSNEIVKGDVPLFGRTLYTIILLLSIVGAGAMYIFSRNVVMMSAEERAQTMLSASQLRAGKSAAIEAKRHDARVEAATSGKGNTGDGNKSNVAATFDVSAVLDSADSNKEPQHYVAGTGVTATEEAKKFEEEIKEMQADHAMEQELKQKGLRGIVQEFGGGRRGQRVTGGVTRTSRPNVEPKSEGKIEEVISKDPIKQFKKNVRKTRKTRKTVSKNDSESDSVVQDPPHKEEDDDFSDFSL